MSSAFTSKNKDKSRKVSSIFSGGKTWFVFAILIAVAAAAVVFGVLSQAVATTTYYVLSKDVPANNQILPDMLKAVKTSSGTAPGNAMTVGEVKRTPTYAKYALKAGDIVSPSNTGPLTPLTAGIPEGYTIASFSADAKDAVSGKIATGNYIDVIATSNDSSGSTAKTVLRHVLVVDVAIDPSKIGDSTQSTTTTTDAAGTAASNATGDKSQQSSTQDKLREGIPSLYTIALTPEDAVKLALIKDSKLLITLSPAENKNGVTPKNIQESLGNVFGPNAVGDSGAGTKSTYEQGTATPSATASPSAAPAPAATTKAPAPTPVPSASPSASDE